MMTDEKILVISGLSGLVGAAFSAVGHAFGFNRRLTDLEKAVVALAEKKEDFLLKKDHDVRCKLNERLFDEKLGRIEQKIDQLITRVNLCKYNQTMHDGGCD